MKQRYTCVNGCRCRVGGRVAGVTRLRNVDDDAGTDLPHLVVDRLEGDEAEATGSQIPTGQQSALTDTTNCRAFTIFNDGVTVRRKRDFSSFAYPLSQSRVCPLVLSLVIVSRVLPLVLSLIALPLVLSVVRLDSYKRSFATQMGSVFGELPASVVEIGLQRAGGLQ